jgi:ribosomal protein L40E
MAQDKYGNKLVCRKCGSSSVRYYGGAIGYEAMVCSKCKTHHTDAEPLIIKIPKVRF